MHKSKLPLIVNKTVSYAFMDLSRKTFQHITTFVRLIILCFHILSLINNRCGTKGMNEKRKYEVWAFYTWTFYLNELHKI